MGEIIFLFVLAAIGGWYFYETFSYTTPIYDKTGGPAVFPRMILILLLICLVVRLIQILVKKERKHFVLLELFTGSTGVFLFAFMAYIFLLEPLGMILDTILYLTFTSHYMIYGRDGTIGSKTSVIKHFIAYIFMSVGIYLFFSKVMNVAVPTGILSFLG